MWQNLFKRAIGNGDMLVNNRLTVNINGLPNNQQISTDILKQIFGNNNQKEWADWTNVDGNNKSEIFINAINDLCSN